jgi:hypothetical protein
VPANPFEPYTLHVTRLKSSVIIGLKFRLPDEEEVANGRYANVTEDSWKLQAAERLAVADSLPQVVNWPILQAKARSPQ